MTDKQPQEMEYIVTKEQLETIENESADAYGDCMIPQEILDVIRSRPNHNTPPQVVYRCCEFYQAPTLDEPKASCKLVQGARQDERAITKKEIKDLKRSLDFYKQRCDELLKAQSKMRDPERKAVCDILANGYTDVLRQKKDDE